MYSSSPPTAVRSPVSRLFPKSGNSAGRTGQHRFLSTGNGKHLLSPNSPGEAWVVEILRREQAIRSGKVNTMHTHLIIVLGQLVSLLG
ncbi:Uncharacterised protein [Amycolatopsis camponoti]|uniref:Uncharacterized protein n=1 Tax=Amycolatopsis camponoti TaxID=2606593 RepID=A0A6I8M3F9_9PSEU|nr:Uncharacterised protein [Amycolatopsis camponoti]